MANKPVAIKVEHLSKDFLLPHMKSRTMKTAFLNAIRTRNTGAEVQHALIDVSFEVKKGEFFGIVGRNGSGKSTLLKMLAGIYQPNAGSVAIDGRLVPFIELGVGFNDELSGRENVYLNGALLGFSKKEIDAMYDDIVSFAELEQFMDQKLKNYSSGMQVRLAFSLATRARADILLVDEVLAVGDAAFQRKCFEYFKQLKKTGVTVVFVSHDMDAVREYCDRAVLIDESHLVLEGSSEKIATAYTKLFNDAEAALTDMQQQGTRWGDESVKYDSISVKLVGDADAATGKVVVEAEATAAIELENPVFGFSVKNSAGDAILGTNTRIRHQKIAHLKPGQKIKLTWEFANLLADGEHTISLTAHNSDGVQIYDWWEDACKFKVFKSTHTAYAITPFIDVQVKTSKK